MYRWIIVAIGVATAILASMYQDWIVAVGAIAATLFALFRDWKRAPAARQAGRKFMDGGDGGAG